MSGWGGALIKALSIPPADLGTTRHIISRRVTRMDYLKGIISALAALFVAVCVPVLWSTFRVMNNEKATGLAALAGGALRELLLTLVLDRGNNRVRVVFRCESPAK